MEVPLVKDTTPQLTLTWGMSLRDLVSHLEATRQGQELFHVCYWNLTYYEENELIASLDRDDTMSYGPETVTVTVSIDRETRYKYYVYDIRLELHGMYLRFLMEK